MKKVFLVSLSVLAFTWLLSSCGGGSEQKTADGKDSANVEEALPADIQAMMAQGEAIYKAKCMACHQDKGQGVPNVFPPLAQADYLLADKVRAVAQTLNGSKEGITVNGVKYSQPMPPQVQTKEEAVAVINYVLNSFGNKGGYVTMEDVKDVVIDPIKL